MSLPPTTAARWPQALRLAGLALALAALGTARVAAQAPTNVWTATASGGWNTPGNWNTNSVPASNATATVLQFNANGTTSYTATNDIGPFSLLGINLNSSSSNPITIADAGGGLTISAAGTVGVINQNGPGAVTISNPLTLTNTSSSTDVYVTGSGSGTETFSGLISGAGGFNFGSNNATTFVLSNGANSFAGSSGLTGGTQVSSPFTTVIATATSGTPLGTAGVQFQAGTIDIAPAATGTGVTVGLAATRNINFLASGNLILDKGGNTSLTFNVNALTFTLSTNSSGAMVLTPASGIAALGTATGEMLVPTAAPTPINGMLPPTLVGQASKTDSTGDFLTFGAAGHTGYSQFQGYTTYNTAGGSFGSSTAGTEVSNVTAATTASAAATIQALRVTNTTLTIGSGTTVTIGGQAWNAGRPNQAGVILNNATIAGPGTLNVGANELDLYASSTGTSTISAQITSTQAGTVPAIVKFGPGNIILANSGNSFAAGAVYTLYGGALGIIGPGGSNQSTALGTGAHTFVMRGGSFAITGGDYAPAANTVGFLLVQGGGGFLVDGTSTLTLAQSGQLSGGAAGLNGSNGPMFKTGTGTLVLGSAYDLSGMTGVVVNQGRLQVNATLTGTMGAGTLAIPVPTVVNNTGTLGGTGSVSGNVVVNAGGTISPGAGSTIGQFAAGGGFTLTPGGSYVVKYNASATSPGATDNDFLASAAGLNLAALSASPGGQFTINLAPQNLPATAPGSPVTFTIGTFNTGVVGASGPLSGDITNLFSFTGLFASAPTVTTSGGNLLLTFTPVPEPGSVLAVCAGAAGLAGWWRRRHQKC
jgi:hypothetical protein